MSRVNNDDGRVDEVSAGGNRKGDGDEGFAVMGEDVDSGEGEGDELTW